MSDVSDREKTGLLINSQNSDMNTRSNYQTEEYGEEVFEEVRLYSEKQFSSVTEEKPEHEGEKRESISVFKILLITISMAGVVFCWAVQIGYATPFERQLGLPREFVSWVWVAGPISGIVVQLIVGSISDKIFIPYVGRRRPWMLLGVLSTSISLVCFSNADLIGKYIFRDTSVVPIVIGIVTFFCLDFSINFVQVSIRSLLVDIVPSHQQTLGNICNTLCTGIGNSVGFGVGSIPFLQVLPFFGNQVRPTFFIGMNVLLFCVLITVTNIHEVKNPESSKKKKIENTKNERKMKEEEKYGDSDSDSDGDEEKTRKTRKTKKRRKHYCYYFVECCNGIKSIPIAFWTAYVVQFMSYIGKFMLYLYMSDYVGEQIFDGDPTQPVGSKAYRNYSSGVRFASVGFLALSIVNVLYAPILNYLTYFVPIKILWMFSQFLQTVALLACPFIYNKIVVIFVFAALGFVETTLNSLPWAIVNATIKESKINSNKGLFQALFNTSQCLPQLLTAAFGALLVFIFNKWGWPAGSVLAVGGVFGFIGFLLIPFTVIPKELSRKRTDCYVKCCPCCCKKSKGKCDIWCCFRDCSDIWSQLNANIINFTKTVKTSRDSDSENDQSIIVTDNDINTGYIPIQDAF